MNAIVKPPLLPVTAEGIPLEMRNRARWAPWRAEWNPKKQKYGKIPHRADRPEHGLSNKSTKGWTTFEKAMAAYRANPERFAGVGYLMTEQTDVVGVDLDHCRDPASGEMAPWAAELIAKLDSYTEVSPSGTGLHVIVAGHVPEDWANFEQGVEVYSGNVPRFLAITGELVPGAPAAVRPAKPAVLDTMAARWRKKLSVAEVYDLRLPDLLPDTLLPDIGDLDLPTHARNFLNAGPEPGDRSRQLFATSIALHQAGCTREEVLSILEQNDHAMEIALDHRRQDYDKALRYLWKDHCQNGGARAEGLRQERFDEFDTLAGSDADIPASNEVAAPAAPQVVDVMDDFEDLGADEQHQQAGPDGVPVEEKRAEPRPAPAKAARFALLEASDFLKRKDPSWLVKDVLPAAGLAVMYGASGSGKSFFMLDMAMCIVTGRAWRGRPLAKGRGVYIVAEGAGGFRKRLAAYCQQFDVDPASLDIRFITDAPNLMDKADIRELLIAILSYGRVDFVVIDTYARAMVGANENDAKDVGLAVAHCEAIHRKTGALVILVHHTGKDASKGARGSVALRGAADAEIEVSSDKSGRAATITKMKDGEDGIQFGFKLQTVVVGLDDEGEEITSCVVAEQALAPVHERKADPKGDVEKLILRYLEALPAEDNGTIEVEELAENVKDLMEFDPAPGKKDRRKEVIKRAIKSLSEKNLVKSDGFEVVCN